MSQFTPSSKDYPSTPPSTNPVSLSNPSDSFPLGLSLDPATEIDQASPLAEIAKAIEYIEPSTGDFILYRNSESPGNF